MSAAAFHSGGLHDEPQPHSRAENSAILPAVWATDRVTFGSYFVLRVWSRGSQAAAVATPSAPNGNHHTWSASSRPAAAASQSAPADRSPGSVVGGAQRIGHRQLHHGSRVQDAIMTRRLRAIDICAGAGGWACAARGLPIDILAAVDLDGGALATYQHNTPRVTAIQADVRDIQGDPRGLMLIKDGRADGHYRGRDPIDLVLGGIPCETISILRNGWAPKTKPESGEVAQWTQTLDACLRLVSEINPRWWCLEDVVQVVRHLPPMTPHVILNSAEFSPQRRRRAYIGSFPVPTPPGDHRLLRDCLRPGPYRLGKRCINRTPVRTNQFGNDTCAYWDPDRKARVICALGSRHDVESVVVDGNLRRQLTWQEAAIAQGFPPDYVFLGSESQVSKWIGQAVQIDTGRAILEAIVREHQGESDESE